MMGVQRALVGHACGRILAGVPGAPVVRELRAQAESAFGRLEAGLGDYAVKPG